MELSYTYWEADEGGYIGYFDDFTSHATQGETLEELEEMLMDLYELAQEEAPKAIPYMRLPNQSAVI